MRMIKRVSGWLTVAVFATVGGLVASDPAFAKTDVDKLTIGGDFRVRYEARTGVYFGSVNAGGILGSTAANTTSNAGNGTLSYVTERVRVNVGYDLTPDVAFFAQLQDARAWGTEISGAAGAQTGSGIGAVSSANSPGQGTNNNASGVDLHQAYIQLKNVLVPGLSLKIGRQEIIYGDHRLFGNFGWSQIGNSFDAAKLMYSTDMVDVDLFWARIADAGNAGLAGANGGVALTNGAQSAYTGIQGTRDQDIYGAYVTVKAIPNWTLEPYYFLLIDNRSAATQVGLIAPGVVTNGVAGATSSLVGPQTADQIRSTLGGRINGKAAGLDATAEGAWQFGSVASAFNRLAASNAAQSQPRDLHVNAVAGAVKVGFTFEPVPMKPRLGIEIDYASGDNAANCQSTGGMNGCNNGHFNTFDNLFPTNHGKFGYMDLMSWRNQVTYQGVFDLKPSPVSKLQINFAILRLANKLDNWYRAGQVPYAFTSATNTTSSLGQELDVHYWHTFKEKFKFEIGVGRFFAGQYLTNSKPGTGNLSTTSFNNDSDQSWGYVMGSVLF
jgi:hypothetical protein